MKKVYLLLLIVGFCIPTYLVIMESIETGNILLYTNPKATFNAMFANSISSIFSIDLFLVVFIFFVWSYHEAKEFKVRGIYVTWLITLLFGLASGLPLFLYLREIKKEKLK